MKKKQIACVVKAPLQLYTLYHILQARARQGLNKLQEYRWVFLEKKAEAEVAAILHDSLLFLFLSVLEGLALTPLEAMLCGCQVMAFGGGPMDECYPASFCLPPNDILGMARQIERLAEAFPERLGEWEDSARAGREAALRFSPEREEQSVLEAWSEILATV